ncbi:MAG: DUF937 domain-containing protein [Saprospiraceae bacterium]
MSNLLDSLQEYVTPELLGQAAKIYGESETGISKAIGSLAPAILAGLLDKSNDSQAMGNIFNTLRNFDPAILGKLGSLFGGGNLAHNDPKDVSGQLLGTIFGAKVPAIAHAVAAFSGVKPSSASSLLGFAGPLVMGLLGKRIHADGLDASGLVSLLLSQKDAILSLLPAGVSAFVGTANIGGAQRAQEEKASVGMAWLWPLLLLLGLGAAIVCCMKNCAAYGG